jgi:hypothetical protein
VDFPRLQTRSREIYSMDGLTFSRKVQYVQSLLDLERVLDLSSHDEDNYSSECLPRTLSEFPFWPRFCASPESEILSCVDATTYTRSLTNSSANYCLIYNQCFVPMSLQTVDRSPCRRALYPPWPYNSRASRLVRQPNRHDPI